MSIHGDFSSMRPVGPLERKSAVEGAKPESADVQPIVSPEEESVDVAGKFKSIMRIELAEGIIELTELGEGLSEAEITLKEVTEATQPLAVVGEEMARGMETIDGMLQTVAAGMLLANLNQRLEIEKNELKLLQIQKEQQPEQKKDLRLDMKIAETKRNIEALEEKISAAKAELVFASSESGLSITGDAVKHASEAVHQGVSALSTASTVLGGAAGLVSTVSAAVSMRKTIAEMQNVSREVKEVEHAIKALGKNGNEDLLAALELKLVYLKKAKMMNLAAELIKNVLSLVSGGGSVASKIAVLAAAKALAVLAPAAVPLLLGAVGIGGVLTFERYRAKISHQLASIPMKIELRSTKQKIKAVEARFKEELKRSEGLTKRLNKDLSQVNKECETLKAKVREQADDVRDLTARLSIAYQKKFSPEAHKKSDKEIKPLQKALQSAVKKLQEFTEQMTEANQKYDDKYRQLIDLKVDPQEMQRAFEREIESHIKARIHLEEKIRQKGEAAERTTEAHKVGISREDLEFNKALIQKALENPETYHAFEKHLIEAKLTTKEEFAKNGAAIIEKYIFA